MKTWSTQVTKSCNASDERIWQLWTDVEHWNQWDKGVQSATLNGPFQTGITGKLKSTGGPKTTFTITECTERVSFTNTTALPLCKMDFIHRLTQQEDTITITHRIKIKGLLTPPILPHHRQSTTKRTP